MESVITTLCDIVRANGTVGESLDRYFSDCMGDVMTKHYKDRQPLTSRSEISREQVDALVDIVYYICDTLVQFGFAFPPYSEQVREFTEQGRGIVCPDTLRCPDTNEQKTLPGQSALPGPNLRFLIVAVLSELIEGVQAENKISVLDFHRRVRDIVARSQVAENPPTVAELFINVYKLILHGLGCSDTFDKAFAIVHTANMNKGTVEMVDGQPKRVFKHKDIGGVKKIIKPDGWKEPDYGDMFAGVAYPDFYSVF